MFGYTGTENTFYDWLDPPRPFNPLILPDIKEGFVWKWFDVTPDDDDDNIDEGNIYGVWLWNDDSSANAAVTLNGDTDDEVTATYAAGEIQPWPTRRLLATGTGGTGWRAGIPFSNFYPKYTETTEQVNRGASANSQFDIPFDDVFDNPVYDLTYSIEASSSVVTASINASEERFEILVVSNGHSDVTLRADYFAQSASTTFRVTGL